MPQRVHVQLRLAPEPVRAAARSFVSTYVRALLELSPRDLRRAPCFAYGRGGIAYALWRAARSSPRERELLDRAAVWTDSAIRTAQRFRMRGWTKTSYSRGLAGLYATRARIAHARGDPGERAAAIARFLDTNRRARGSLELFQGAAGRLAGTAVLCAEIPDPELRRLGSELADRVAKALDDGWRGLLPHGVAHGPAGLVLALLVWNTIEATISARRLRRYVTQLHPYRPIHPAWANGAAGMTLVFSRAHRTLGDRRFLTWARAAALAADAPVRRSDVLAGAAGIAYALRALAASDPDGPWLERSHAIALELLGRIEVPAVDPYGVWSGLSGVACLCSDIDRGVDGGLPGVEI